MDTNEIRQALLNDPAVIDQIRHRAFEIFKSSGYLLGRDFENWVQAESEILPVLVEAEQRRGFTASVAAAVNESAIAEEAVESPAPAKKPAAKKAAKPKEATETKAVTETKAEPKTKAVKTASPAAPKATAPKTTRKKGTESSK